MLGIALNKLKKYWIFASYSLLVLFALMSYQRSKIWESDVYLWKDVLSNYPDVAQAWNNLGNLYLEENKIQLALQHYNKALELQSQYADAYSNRGVIYSGMGRNDLAMRDFRKALQLRPHADAYFNLANELVKQKDFQQGIENFNRSIELKASPDAYANRAFAKLNLGRDASAMHDLNAAIQLDPNFADAYYLKAMYQLQKANGSEGCMNLKKAAELGHVNAMQAVKKFCG